ncbi:MAG: zinc ribbon domain-containing protein [Myxococcota bacterium]|nr:zinc ribbon domain-containing protein [Myxococcota bacterium]
MPIYEYRCDACGHEFEVMQKISDRPIRKCEACKKLKAKRQISQTSFILKGSGWYVTDYKGKKPTDTNGGASSDKKSDDTPAETPKKEATKTAAAKKEKTAKAASAT